MNPNARHHRVRVAWWTGSISGVGLAVLALLAEPARGASGPSFPALIFQAQAESRVRITGHATLGSWACESKEIIAIVEPGPELAALADGVSRGGDIPAFDAKNFRVPHALITIPVVSLQCDKPGMRVEVLRVLRQEDAPLIVFLLTGISDVQVQPHGEADQGRYQVMAHGNLVLAGKLRAIELTADVVQESTRRFRLDAVKELRMSDFDITPPTGLFGLIRANDHVTVAFNLTFELVSSPLPAATITRSP